jgi:hypothetical protein
MYDVIAESGLSTPKSAIIRLETFATPSVDEKICEWGYEVSQNMQLGTIRLL